MFVTVLYSKTSKIQNKCRTHWVHKIGSMYELFLNTFFKTHVFLA